MQWLYVGLGAALGACLRAWLARYNTSDPASDPASLLGMVGWSWLPLGTLLANIIGGLLIGVAMVILAYFDSSYAGSTGAVGLPSGYRLFLVTGFLGGLTTFSSFSAEVFVLINSGRVAAGLAVIGLHLLLTLVATAVGFYLTKGLLVYLAA